LQEATPSIEAELIEAGAVRDGLICVNSVSPGSDPQPVSNRPDGPSESWEPGTN
jgi:hypothetical protein